jgi:hypothetical protein
MILGPRAHLVMQRFWDGKLSSPPLRGRGILNREIGLGARAATHFAAEGCVAPSLCSEDLIRAA